MTSESGMLLATERPQECDMQTRAGVWQLWQDSYEREPCRTHTLARHQLEGTQGNLHTREAGQLSHHTRSFAVLGVQGHKYWENLNYLSFLCVAKQGMDM